MGEDASLRFPDAPIVATADPEVQRLRAAVAAKLTGSAPAPVRVGRFVILERVGAGAMGVVYAAYDAELDRKLAIKILQPTGDDSGVRQRLVREAQAMARLSHPNVVGVFEIGEHDGHGFVAMEFVRGATLREWLAAAKRTPAAILGAYLQAGRGLAAAHVAGIVHRDFKPDNVLVDAEHDGQGAPRVRVTDFGLAQTGALSEAATSLSTGVMASDVLITRAGVRVGTPGYMAPEQILGEPTDARSDQFAFCVALWEALAGERPFAGRNASEVFEHVLQAKLRSPPRGTIPPWIEAALRVGLAEQPANRHAGMAELLARLGDDPRRRRRRRLAIAVGVAAVPLAALGWQARAQMIRSACADEAGVIDELWHPQQADAVRAAFATTAASNANAMAERVLPRVDAYAQQWRDAADTVCRARVLERELDDAAAERASACLGQQREGLATVLAAFAAPDRGVVDASVSSVLQLPLPQRCTEAAALALERRAPSDPETRAGMRTIEAEIAAAEAMRRLGRNREALDHVEALVEPAAALQWAPLLALLDFRRAQIHLTLGDYPIARELGERSFFTAYRVGDERTAAVAASLVSQHFVVATLDAAAAEHWDQLATGALERIEGDATRQQLFHAVVAGRRAMVLGDLDQGEIELERALAFGERLNGPDHPALFEILSVLSNLQSRRNAYPESRASAERAYAVISAAVGDDHPQTARALAGLGLAIHYDGDSEQGLAHIDLALATDERLFGADNLNVAVDLSYGALILEESGHPHPAIDRLERALPIYRAAFGDDHPEVEIVLGNLARAQQRAGELREAHASIDAAIAMHARTGNGDTKLAETNAITLAQIAALEAERR